MVAGRLSRTLTQPVRRGANAAMAVMSMPSEPTAANPASAASAILVVDDIVKRFETPDGVLTAVDHVSFTIAPGEFLAVIGPSGCGKSTLFNVMGGLLD